MARLIDAAFLVGSPPKFRSKIVDGSQWAPGEMTGNLAVRVQQ
jgi:hypothetical protein